MMAGQKAEALTAFLGVIEERERALDAGGDLDSSPALQEPPLLLAEAARTLFKDELQQQVAALLRREKEERGSWSVIWRAFGEAL